MAQLENLAIVAPDFDRIRRDAGVHVEDAIRLLWLAQNDTRADVRRALKSRSIQVVRASTSTEVSTASASFVTTGLSATITPLRTDSTIIIALSQQYRAEGSGGLDAEVRLVRSGTALVQIAASPGGGAGGIFGSPGYSAQFTDSPGPGEHTYRTEFRKNSGTFTLYAQRNNITVSTMVLTEVSP